MKLRVLKETWQELFSLGVQIKMLAPWNWMEDYELIGVRIPDSEEVLYATTSEDEESGIGFVNLYTGAEGLENFNLITESEGEEDPTMLLLSWDCVMLSFESEEDLMDEEKALYKSLNIRFKGQNSFPVFRDYTPGFMPWQIESETQAQSIITALKQCINIWESAKEDIDFLVPPEGMEEDMYFTASQVNGEWTSDWELCPEYKGDEEGPLFKIDTIRLQSILGRLPKKNVAWMIDISLMELPVQEDPSERPYFPEIFILVDEATSMIIGVEAFPKKTIQSEFQKTLITFCQKEGGLPNKFLATSDYVAECIQPFADVLGITVEVDEVTAEFLDEIKLDMTERYLSDGEK
jgi:hypothetical protein